MSPGDDPRPCRKCGQAPFIVIDRIHVECKACFIESSHKKFKQALGKTQLVRNDDSLLVAYSGGQSSCVLLDMIKSRIDSSSAKEPKLRPSLLHIDMQSITCSSSLANIESDRLKNLDHLLDGLKKQCPDWPIYWTSIEMCMVNSSVNHFNVYNSIKDIIDSPMLKNEEAHFELQDAFGRLDDLTDKQKLVGEKCTHLINLVADEINLGIKEAGDKLKFVLVGSSATQLANNLLVDVILGHGSTIRPTISISDERPPVTILRPLKDFSKKEIAFYLIAKNLEASTQPNFLTKTDRKACIQTVTETFLSKLYVDYPATYSTLLRTGGKLA